MSDKSLSIVIASWNTAALLMECLRSIPAAVTGLDYEVIVVDNASTDGSQDCVRTEFPDVALLCNSENTGFARANNQGMLHSRGKYILLLNSDTLVRPRSLTALVQFMDDHPQAGVVGPRLLRPDGTPQHYAFGGDPTLAYLIRRACVQRLSRVYLHDWATDDVQIVDWVSGACLMARAEAIEQVGLLDENFFMYFEDTDWCLRFRMLGWTVYYNPEVEVLHIGGQSLKKSRRSQELYHTSLRYFYAKHYSAIAHLLLRGLLRLNAMGG